MVDPCHDRDIANGLVVVRKPESAETK